MATINEMAERIKGCKAKKEVTGDWESVQLKGALEASLEGEEVTKDNYTAVLKHHNKFVSALAQAAGDIAIDDMKENEKISRVTVTAPIGGSSVDEVTINRVHEPEEGTPVYGHTVVKSGFAMDEESSASFKKTLEKISEKAAKALSE